MKDKTIAAVLALFLGYFGAHRFYLFYICVALLYFFLAFTGSSFLLSFIDFFRFLFMDQQRFDFAYNRNYFNYVQAAGTDFDRHYHRRPVREEQPPAREPRGTRVIPVRPSRSVPTPKKKTTPSRPRASQSNHYHQRGIEKYRNFDYPGASQDFIKALEIEPHSIAVHFNIACAYSLTEQADQSFFHLSKAVEYGFKDFEKIRSHDALAYIRIKDEFQDFAQNGYRLVAPQPASTGPAITAQPDLLEQLRQLGELRDRELLTEEEFLLQKKKLLG